MSSPLKTGYNPIDAIFDTFKGILDIATFTDCVPDSSSPDDKRPDEPYLSKQLDNPKSPADSSNKSRNSKDSDTKARRIKFDESAGPLKDNKKTRTRSKQNMSDLILSVEQILKQSNLKIRQSKGGEQWDDRLVTLTVNFELVLDNSVSNTSRDIFKMSPSCSVFETNLSENAFEVVTPQKILHLKTTSKEETSNWISIIRETISKSTIDKDDPLLRASLAKSRNDVFYDVEFIENKPLGVVLERSGEWVIF